MESRTIALFLPHNLPPKTRTILFFSRTLSEGLFTSVQSVIYPLITQSQLTLINQQTQHQLLLLSQFQALFRAVYLPLYDSAKVRHSVAACSTVTDCLYAEAKAIRPLHCKIKTLFTIAAGIFENKLSIQYSRRAATVIWVELRLWSQSMIFS